jgi:dCMP deaminase
MDCARAIVQAGIIELVAIKPDTSHHQWGEDFKLSLELLAEAGVQVRWYEAE